MIIEIVVDRDKARVAHRLLKERLAKTFPDAGVALCAALGRAALPGAVPLLLKFERLAHRRGRATVCDPLPDSELDAPLGRPDLVIDLSSNRTEPAAGVLMLRPLYDNEIGEAAIIGALLQGRAPHIAIENASTGEIVASGAPSLETSDGLTGGLEAVYSRAVLLIAQAAHEPRRAAMRPLFDGQEYSNVEVVRYAAKNLAWTAARALYHLTCYSPHWFVGWRFNDGPGVMDLGSLDGPAWNILPDSGYQCFADPFPFMWRGRAGLFFESLDHRVGKGVISAVEFGPEGPIGDPVVVIEEPWHLSYPFLIEAEGELWMIPEASLSGQVPLYRCVEFPHRWERRDPLLEGIEAADATIFRHENRYYMTTVIREGLGGYSDTLAIFYASSLFGPWLPHASMRPTLIDASAARPAGAVVERSGVLWRPVQDCSRGYGRAVRLAQITRIDPEHFEQTFVSRVGPGSLWPGGRLHTLNRAGRLEVIDGAVPKPKFPALRRPIRTNQKPRAVSEPVALNPPPTAVQPARERLLTN
jgi:hypothetical protein